MLWGKMNTVSGGRGRVLGAGTETRLNELLMIEDSSARVLLIAILTKKCRRDESPPHVTERRVPAHLL